MCWLLMAVFASTVVAQAKPTSLPSESIQVGDRPGFIFWPEESLRQTPQPWVFYAPTLLPQYPDSHEKWMHEQFLAAGIAVAGLDVGEAYGNPAANQAFDQLYAMLIEKYKFAPRPCVLGRSRGGLWVSSWAAAHPERIAGLAGIYPVFDITSYPGLAKAAPAYQLSPEALQAKLIELNPIENVSRLTKAKIPVCIIHGAVDKVVPIEPNSQRLLETYRSQGQADLVQLIVVKDQGHNFWEGFFRCQELIDFVIASAKSGGTN